MSKELQHQINLVIGDWSKDGHNQTETITIRCNVDKEQLKKAFNAGCQKTGVKFDKVASKYEDNHISTDVVVKLSKHGFNIADYSEDEEPDDEGYTLWVDGYAHAWLFVAKIGNPDIAYEEMSMDNPDVHIGGYGLFN